MHNLLHLRKEEEEAEEPTSQNRLKWNELNLFKKSDNNIFWQSEIENKPTVVFSLNHSTDTDEQQNVVVNVAIFKFILAILRQNAFFAFLLCRTGRR